MQSTILDLKEFYDKSAVLVDLQDHIPNPHEQSRHIADNVLEYFKLRPEDLVGTNVQCLTVVRPYDWEQKIGGYWVRFIAKDNNITAFVKTDKMSDHIPDLMWHVTGLYSINPDAQIHGMILGVHSSPSLKFVKNLYASEGEVKLVALHRHLKFWKKHYPENLASNINNIQLVEYSQYMEHRDKFDKNFIDKFSFVVMPEALTKNV